MMTPIDPKTQMVVDRTDYSEIAGAEAADVESNQVTVREITYSGERCRTIWVAAGIRIVRRR